MSTIAYWNDLPDLAAIAELMGEAPADLTAELATLPAGVRGVAVCAEDTIHAAALFVDLDAEAPKKCALARICECRHEAALALVAWAEGEARRRGAARLEASVRRSDFLPEWLVRHGYVELDANLTMRRHAVRPVPPLPTAHEQRTLDDVSVDEWHLVSNESFRDVPFSAPMTREESASMLAAPDLDRTLIRVVFDSAGPMGFLRGALSTALEGEIAAIGLLPRARRRGLGRWLLRRCEQLLDERGAKRMFLRVTASNAPAVALYRKEGYVEEKRLPVWVRDLT